MQQNQVALRDVPPRRIPHSWRIGPRILASLIGTGLAIFMLFSAGIDPWRWWLNYQSDADEQSMRKEDGSISAGPVSAVQPEPVGTDSSVATSPAPLILKATRLGRNLHEGYAELGVNPASPQTYRAGAILANGARIEEIHSDHIVLARDAARARLYVDGRAPTYFGPSDGSLLMVGGATAAAPARSDSKEELTDHIRVAPVYEGDAIRALEVYSTQDSNVFSTLGLEPGDYITAIDGQAITNSAEAIASLRQLTSGAALLVTVERNGRPQVLSLDGLVFTTALSADVK